MARQHEHNRGTKVPEIRRGDTVMILAGKDAGKRGVVERVVRRTAARSAGRSLYRRTAPTSGVGVVVEGLNVARRHTKARMSQGSSDRQPKTQQGGILDIPMPVPASRVMLVCPKCEQPGRVSHTTLESGRRIRVCRHCGEPLEVTPS
jgi:large subunit ribosomal protein L24